jgi:hypothetical protein
MTDELNMKNSIKIAVFCTGIIFLFTGFALAVSPLVEAEPSKANPDYAGQEVGLVLRILDK